MDDKRKSRKKARGVLAIAFLLLLPVLYVLSVGPAQWLLMTDRISGKTYSAVYKPLGLASYSSETVFAFLAWYCPKFRPASTPRPGLNPAPAGSSRPTSQAGNSAESHASPRH